MDILKSLLSDIFLVGFIVFVGIAFRVGVFIAECFLDKLSHSRTSQQASGEDRQQ